MCGVSDLIAKQEEMGENISQTSWHGPPLPVWINCTQNLVFGVLSYLFVLKF